MIDVEINGLNELKIKLTEKLPQAVKQGIRNGLEDTMDKAEGYAVDRINSDIKHSSGELVRSFRHEVVEDSAGNTAGRLWNTAKHAIYREFGTGVHGQESAKELPPNASIAYRQIPWFIPAWEVDVDLHAIYGMPVIKIGKGDSAKKFYRSNGQPARQFLTPAIKQVSEEADSIIKSRVDESMKGGLS